MSISGINLRLKTTQFGGENNIFDSQQIRWVRGGVTIDAATVGTTVIDNVTRKILPIGTPLGKITASGKYGPYDVAAVDGRATAVLMLGETVELTDGDVGTTAFDMARVITARLPVAITQAIKDGLKFISFV